MSARPGRNDPCPCGSGRKYKQCHMRGDDEARGAQAQGERLARVVGDVTFAVHEYARGRFGEAWEDQALGLSMDPEEALPLLAPFAAYHLPVEGRTAAEWYLAEHARGLSEDARTCLRAEGEAWLSLWEVVESRPGEGLTLRDRLSGATHDVLERTASQILARGHTVLARVVDLGGVYVIDGLYPQALPPWEGVALEERARGYLRRKRDVPIERLREPKVGRYLIARFEEELLDLEENGDSYLNSDGDVLLFTTDHFALTDGGRQQVEGRLEALGAMRVSEPEDADTIFAFLDDAEVVLGEALLTGATLRLETNSRQRADRLRAQIEAACEGLLAHRVREHEDPLSEARERGAEGDERRQPSVEEAEILRAYKEQHYAEWLEQSIPALDGQTPRAAAGTREGRRRVAALLDQIEQVESQLYPEERFDVEVLRKELGIER